MAGRVLLHDLIDGIKARAGAPENERVLASVRFAARILSKLTLRSPVLAPLQGALQALLGETTEEGSRQARQAQAKIEQLRQRLSCARTSAERQKIKEQLAMLHELFARN